MFTENYSDHLERLHNGDISHTEFIALSGNDGAYKKWCKEHALKPSEDNAELFFDMFGFEETEIVKEYIEPVF